MPRVSAAVIPAAFLGLAVGLSGCGASDGAGGPVNTEQQARFKTLQKLGESNTKQAIAENKKKAAAESAQKTGGKSQPPKS
jgi:hypothetical protein